MGSNISPYKQRKNVDRGTGAKQLKDGSEIDMEAVRLGEAVSKWCNRQPVRVVIAPLWAVLMVAKSLGYRKVTENGGFEVPKPAENA